MTPLVLLESADETPVARLLGALGVVFERRTLAEALASAGDSPAASTALMLSEEQLADAHDQGVCLKEFLCGHRHALVYPFRGTAEGLRALSECIEGRAEAEPLDSGSTSSYLVTTDFAAAGAFTGLNVSPAAAMTDCRLRTRESPHPIEQIISVGDGGLFIRITFPSSELFVTSSTAVFDVEAEVVKNLEAAQCFSALVPLLLFLRHSQVAFWRNSYPAANVIIDDLNLRPRYGFVDTRMLAGLVDELGCAVSIAFIPWNSDRTSQEIVDLFRARWPRLSLCIHGCDHVGGEFATGSLSHAVSMIAMSVDRMQTLTTSTGVRYDKVMVFPQGKFSHTAMEALRQSNFVAAVNTELVDDRTHHGVRAGELLRPAITSYGGFPLFLRRNAREPIANFALDLLLGKPCLVVTHHGDFKEGMRPLAALVRSLNALDPALEWTNLETIASRTYGTRVQNTSLVDIRLFAASTVIEPGDGGGEIRFSKAEPLADKHFQVLVEGQPVHSRWQGGDIVFSRVMAAAEPTAVDVRVSRLEPTPPTIHPLSYRVKVAARRYLSEIRDNYVATSPWATATARSIRGVGARL